MSNSAGHDQLLEHLIGAIYDAGLAPETWPSVLRAIEHAAGGDVAAMFFHDRARPAEPIALLAMSGYHETVPDQYREHFAARDVRIAPITALPQGGVYSDDRHLSFAEIQKSEIYNEFYRPLGLGHGMAINLFAEGQRVGLLSTHRTAVRGGFDPKDIALLERLAPHIVRALQVQRQLARAEAVAGGLATGIDHFAIAVLLVDRTGLVVEQNSAAGALLSRPGCPLRLEGRRLTATRPADAALLRRVIETAARTLLGEAAPPPGLLRLGGKAGTPGLTVMAAPVRRGDRIGLLAEPLALVFVSDPAAAGAADHSLLAHQFGLSAAEAAIAARLLDGDNVTQIAGERGVSLETVRSQVKNVLSKTQTRSQGQLMSLLARSLAVLRRPGR